MNESIIRDLIKYMDVEDNGAIQYIQTEHRMKLGLFWGIQEGSRVLEIGCGQEIQRPCLHIWWGSTGTFMV